MEHVPIFSSTTDTVFLLCTFPPYFHIDYISYSKETNKVNNRYLLHSSKERVIKQVNTASLSFFLFFSSSGFTTVVEIYF